LVIDPSTRFQLAQDRSFDALSLRRAFPSTRFPFDALSLRRAFPSTRFPFDALSACSGQASLLRAGQLAQGRPACSGQASLLRAGQLAQGQVLTVSKLLRDVTDLPLVSPPSPIPGSFFLYILLCQDSSLYVGITQDVAGRLALHHQGTASKFTRVHRPARLVYTEGPFSEEAAVQRERQLKRWSRSKKLALIRNEIDQLRNLSRSHD
jgi:putative endonuclease